MSGRRRQHAIRRGPHHHRPKPKPRRKTRHSKEHHRRVAFLTACVNFNSCKQNAMLLLYGYIREQTAHIPLYEYIPSDIVHLIYTICYRQKKFHEGNTHNFWDDKSIQKLNTFDGLLTETIYQLDTTNTIVKVLDASKPRNIAVVTRITGERIRKVWRFKVLHASCSKSKVVLRMTLKEYNTYTVIRGIPKQFELIDPIDNVETIGCATHIKSGDLITVLFINNKGHDKFTQYAINETLYPLRTIPMTEMQLFRRRYRLIVSVASPV
eukprot:257549_1